MQENFPKFEIDPSFKFDAKQFQYPNFKYLNKIIKKSTNQSIKNSVLKDMKLNDNKYRKMRMPSEPNDLHASHLYVKRDHKSVIETSENEEENPPETIQNKKKITKLKEKLLKSRKTRKFFSQIPNFPKEKSEFIPLYTETKDSKNPDIFLSNNGSNILFPNNENFFSDLWGKIDCRSDNEDNTIQKKHKGKHNMTSSLFKTQMNKIQKNHYIEENSKEYAEENDFLAQNENEINDNNFEDVLANFGIEHKSIKNEINAGEFEEEEEENQIDNDFDNNGFIDDFTSYQYNE